MTATKKPLSITLLNYKLFETATEDEEVVFLVKELAPDHPISKKKSSEHVVPNGIRISDNLTLIHAEGRKETITFPGSLGDLIVLNPITGQRTQIMRVSKNPRPKKVLRVGNGNFNRNSFYYVSQIRHWDPDSRCYGPNGLLNLDNKELFKQHVTDYPAYFVHQEMALLVNAETVDNCPTPPFYGHDIYAETISIRTAHEAMVKKLKEKDLLDFFLKLQ